MLTEQDKTLAVAEARRKSWDRQASAFAAAHVFLGAAAVALPLIVASSITSPHASKLSCIAAVTAGLTGFLNLRARADRMREAWDILDRALRRYHAAVGRGKVTPKFTETLQAAIDRGEDQIRLTAAAIEERRVLADGAPPAAPTSAGGGGDGD